jgi:hypothetical protein
MLPERQGTIVETAELIADAGGAAIPGRIRHPAKSTRLRG